MIVAKIWYKSQYATNYFGQPMNGVGILRILFKEMAKELNVELR